MLEILRKLGMCLVANQTYSHWHSPSLCKHVSLVHPLACANICYIMVGYLNSYNFGYSCYPLAPQMTTSTMASNSH